MFDFREGAFETVTASKEGHTHANYSMTEGRGSDKKHRYGTHLRPRNGNEYTLKPFPRIYWRASPVPAVAVIPATIAYIKVVVVKMLLVGSRLSAGGSLASGGMI